MADGFERIEKAFEQFRSLVEHCRNEATSDMADIQDAYNRLNRLRGRYDAEKKKLDSAERDALQKVFEEDNFIANMLIVRVIGEHVLRSEGAILSYPDNSTFSITSASSAAAVFKDRCVNLTDTNGVKRPWDHLRQLTAAIDRIARAMAKAKASCTDAP